MANISYIRVLNVLESFASEHLQIKKFASDFPAQIPNFGNKDEEYPILFVSPSTSIFNENTKTFDLQIYCFDLIQADRANINTILSDTNSILNDLVIWLQNSDQAGIDLIDSSSANPINNSLLDYAAGWVMTIKVEVNSYTMCDIPFENLPISTECSDISYSKYLTCETLEECPVIQEIQGQIDMILTGTSVDTYLTGGTYDIEVGTATFTRSNGATFNVTGFTDETLVISVTNKTGSLIPKGSAVYINGAQGSKPTIALALADTNVTTSLALGITKQDIANNASGYVVNFGLATKLNTSTFVNGDKLFLSPTIAGGLTTTIPTSPNNVIFVGTVTNAHATQGSILVNVLYTFKLDRLSDVAIATPIDGQVLTYETSTSLWKNKVLPIDIRITGGTYAGGTTTFRNNTGGTFTVTGYNTGTVTNVSALTLGTSGTDANSSVTNSSTTPVITLNLPSSSASNRGLLTSADWTIFNNKQSALGFTPANNTTTINTTAPLQGGGDLSANRTLSITQAGSGSNGYLSSIDWNTFNNKQTALNGTGFVKIVGTTISYDNSTYVSTGRTLNVNGNNFDLSANREWRTAQGDTGVLTFGYGLSANTTTTIKISPITGYIVDNETNPASPTYTFVNYSGTSSITVTTLSSGTETFVMLDSNGISFQNTLPTSAQRKAKIWLGKVSHPAGLITIVPNEPDYITSPQAFSRDLFQALGPYINDGVYPYANGANLLVNITNGNVHGNGINLHNSKTTPNEIQVGPFSTGMTFVYRTQTGGTSSAVTNINPAVYDVNGVITAIGGASNNSTLQYIFLIPGQGFLIQYGQTIYATLAEAVANIGKESLILYPNLVDNSLLIGVLAVNRLATNLNNIVQAQFFKADKFGQIIGAAGGSSTTSLQIAYNNSLQPQIITNSTLGAFQIKGWDSGTVPIFQTLNTAGTVTFNINENGNVTGNTFVKTGGLSTQYLMADGSVSTGTSAGVAFDVYVTGGTYAGGTATFRNNTGGTFNVTGFAISGGGGSVTSVAALTLGTTGTDLSSSVANPTTTPVITLNVPNASASNRGALTSTDWSTFNNKQPQLNGTGLVRAVGTVISYDTTAYLTAYTDTYSTAVTYSNNVITVKRNQGLADMSILINTMTGLTISGALTAGTIVKAGGSATQFLKADGSSDSTVYYPNSNPNNYTSADRFVTGGTYVKNTGVITFTNNSAGTFTVTGVTDTFATGGTYAGGIITVTNNSGSSFNITSIPVGTVTNVSALTLGTTGTDLNSSVATNTTTPVITLNVPNASASNRGALTSTDWSTFNNKQALLVSGTNIKTINGNSLLGSGDLVISGSGGGATLSGGVANNITKWLSSSAVTTSNISDTGSLITLSSNTRVLSAFTANTIIKAGGLSTQYLMADGSVTVGTPPAFDRYTTGATYTNATGTLALRDNSGTTINVTGFTTGSTGGGTTLKWYAEPTTTPVVPPLATNAGTGSIAIGDGASTYNGGVFAVGKNAGSGATSAYDSIFIGQETGLNNFSGENCIFMGYGAGRNSGSAGGSVFIGVIAGDGSSSSNAVFIGPYAGYNATSSSSSIFIGESAGYQATGSDTSIFIGSAAGNGVNSDYSILMGYQTGRNFTSNSISNYNIILGTNVSLPNGTSRGLNIGGVLFGSGLYNSNIGDPSIVANSGGKIGINVVTPTEALDISGNVISNQYKLRALNTAPASSGATGTLGEIRWDANFMYVCTATNTWKRSALTSW